MHKKYIPNFSTLSTLLDRLAIENVKLAYFECLLEDDEIKNVEYEKKIKVQKLIIEELKKETTKFMKKVFLEKDYSFIKEERTFK